VCSCETEVLLDLRKLPGDEGGDLSLVEHSDYDCAWERPKAMPNRL
jgi:hypothetical protein